MDIEKTGNDISNTISKNERVVVNVVKRNFNFIRNLRKYITNENKLFEEVVISRAIKIGLILLSVDFIILFFNYSSILGIIPKILTVILLYLYSIKSKSRRN